jgi:hypothetical protein
MPCLFALGCSRIIKPNGATLSFSFYGSEARAGGSALRYYGWMKSLSLVRRHWVETVIAPGGLRS